MAKKTLLTETTKYAFKTVLSTVVISPKPIPGMFVLYLNVFFMMIPNAVMKFNNLDNFVKLLTYRLLTSGAW